MNVFFISVAVLAAVVLGVVLKIRKMPQYKIVSEDDMNGNLKWFVKIRRGFSYYYLEQTHDLPGYADDIFETSKLQVGPQESEQLAEKIIINHRMTTVNGIEVEGE
jgi:hypothetical protein